MSRRTQGRLRACPLTGSRVRTERRAVNTAMGYAVRKRDLIGHAQEKPASTARSAFSDGYRFL